MKPKYELARKMRRALTPPEYLLWERIGQRQTDGPVFRRQYAMGPYVLDFYCVRARVAVEVDGFHHSLDEHIQRDTQRDDWLRQQAIEVYRIQAADVFADADGAADGIILLANERLKGQ